jgi:hypothetical protein
MAINDLQGISAILPELADGNTVDWGRPLAALSKEQMLVFLNDALTLIAKAMAARDRGQGLVTLRFPTGVTDGQTGTWT